MKIEGNEIRQHFEKVWDFYGAGIKRYLECSKCTITVKEKSPRTRRNGFKEGCFDGSVILYNPKKLLAENKLDLVFAHEVAHLVDARTTTGYKNLKRTFRFASSYRKSEEHKIAELFRSKMFPVPQKRSNCRGRTSELFARAIEECYAIETHNTEWIYVDSLTRKYYVDAKIFEKELLPVVHSYLDKLNKEYIKFFDTVAHGFVRYMIKEYNETGEDGIIANLSKVIEKVEKEYFNNDTSKPMLSRTHQLLLESRSYFPL